MDPKYIRKQHRPLELPTGITHNTKLSKAPMVGIEPTTHFPFHCTTGRGQSHMMPNCRPKKPLQNWSNFLESAKNSQKKNTTTTLNLPIVGKFPRPDGSITTPFNRIFGPGGPWENLIGGRGQGTLFKGTFLLEARLGTWLVP